MTTKDYQTLLDSDAYLIERKAPTTAEEQLFLRETNFRCCLCGKELRSRSQKKSNKLYEIAHIYPNRPTQAQYIELNGLERLGDNTESFENKIALCKDCHGTQDYRTSSAEYLSLVAKKQMFIRQSALQDTTNSLGLENEISQIIIKISNYDIQNNTPLNFTPIALSSKFDTKDKMLKSRISGYVTEYFPYIRESFRDIDGTNRFNYSVLCMQIRAAFIKMEQVSPDKVEIYDALTDWIQSVAVGCSKIACEIL